MTEEGRREWVIRIRLVAIVEDDDDDVVGVGVGAVVIGGGGAIVVDGGGGAVTTIVFALGFAVMSVEASIGEAGRDGNGPSTMTTSISLSGDDPLLGEFAPVMMN
jgi:hypothetical protein